MTPNVLTFPMRTPVSAPSPAPTNSAEIIPIGEYRKQVRPLRLATGVFFVTHGFHSPEDYSAA
jgi:hypothetical protein